MTSIDKDVEKLGLFCTVGKNVKWCSFYGKQYGLFLKKSKTELSHDPTIPFLGIVSRTLETILER